MLRGHVEHIDSGGWRIGRLLVVPGRQYADAPRVDACTTTLSRHHQVPDGELQVTTEHFGGAVIRYGRLEHGTHDRGGPGVAALTVAWRDAPMLPVWISRPSLALARARWVLRGRPKLPPQTTTAHSTVAEEEWGALLPPIER